MDLKYKLNKYLTKYNESPKESYLKKIHYYSNILNGGKDTSHNDEKKQLDKQQIYQRLEQQRKNRNKIRDQERIQKLKELRLMNKKEISPQEVLERLNKRRDQERLRYWRELRENARLGIKTKDYKDESEEEADAEEEYEYEDIYDELCDKIKQQQDGKSN